MNRLMSNEVTADFLLLKQVLMFAINTGGVIGHAGLIEDDNYDRLIALEGKINLPGDREVVGVFRRTGRTLSDTNEAT